MGSQKGQDFLAELLRDNATYCAGKSESQAVLSSDAVRHDLAENGQKPVAAVVACADSRVGPEIVFAAGIGRVFVIRNAGNSVDDVSVTASLEYAVCHLNVPLVIILGHSKCGAITAAVNAAKERIKDPESADNAAAKSSPLGQYVNSLAKVVEPQLGSDDELNDSITCNVHHGVNSLKNSKGPLADAYGDGKVEIVGAVYDITTGEVSTV